MVERYEYIEGTSKKFWEIERAGKKYTARWGRIGAGVNSNEKSFPTEAAAKKAADKAIAEKVAKGYQKVGASKATARTKPAAAKSLSNPALEAVLAEQRDDKGSWQIYADWLLEQGEPWGEMIVKACGSRNPKAKLEETGAALLDGLDGSTLTWKYGVIDTIALAPEETPEDAAGELVYPATLERILRHPAGRLVRAIELGLPPLVPGNIHWHFEGLIQAIAAAGPLPLLESLDMTPRAEHMDQRSWRRIGDLRKLWKAAPRLRRLAMEGSNGSDGGAPIKLGDIVAPHLEHFRYISSGLDRSVLTDLAKASLPALEHLELYFGREDYGNTCTMATLAKLLASTGMPKLSYLGLKNSEWEADFVKTIAKGRLLSKIARLDLSLGVFHTEGPQALIDHAARFAHLESIDLTDNFIPDDTCRALRQALPNVDCDLQRDDDEPDYRFCEVGE